ncbi:MAG: hypothetical protein EU530_11750 [Promethearchaeota archaeon]|nr:MAG: hypothetical protein EU530_11750 [Candidatus Lokiarchaeota archaeon]
MMAKINKKNLVEGIALGIFIVFFMGLGAIVGWRLKPQVISEPEFNVLLDGIIHQDEWEGATYNIPFYLDVDNHIDPLVNISNVDGFNFISIGEDENYYYVGLDLCSDRTNNMEGEWISLGIGNRLPKYGGKMAFYALEDYGFEYLMYNVSQNQVFEHQVILSGGIDSYYDIPFVPEYDSYEARRGELEGDYRDIWDIDDFDTFFDIEDVVTLSSVYCENTSFLEAGDYVIVDFAVNVSKMLPTYNATELLPTITDFDMNYDIMGNVSASSLSSIYNETVDTIYYTVLEHGPMPGVFENISYISEKNNHSFTNNGYFSYISTDFEESSINLTNGMFYFSILGYNPENQTDPTAFELYLNRISFKFTMDAVETTKGTSISSENYELAFSYGISENCFEEHRMFEFKVAKSEFPNVEDEMLYVNVAGYGTMSMEGTNWWIYPGYDYHYEEGPLYEFYQYELTFLKLDMSWRN